MSKLFLKMAGVTAIIMSCLYLFLFIMIHIAIPYTHMAVHISDYIFVLTLVCLSLISCFGGLIVLHYNRLSDEELKNKKNYILFWSVIFFMSSGIAGILGLVAYGLMGVDDGSKINYIREIKELEKLKQRGLITEEEFVLKKKKILDI